MSQKIMIRTLGPGLTCCLFLLTSVGRAQTIQLTIPDTVAKKGDTVLIPIRTSPLLTQDSVYSGQFTISYNAGVIDVFGVDTSGTLMQSVGTVLFNTTTKRFAFASTSIVTGGGVLVYLRTRALLNPTNESTTVTISPPDTAFNEGKPKFTVTGGSLRILKIVVSPKTPSQSPVVGDSLQFSVTGDQLLPLTWKSSDTLVATINPTGKMHANSAGQVKISVRDSQGLQDSTNLFAIYPAQARSLTVSVQNTSHTQTLSFNLPIYVSDVTGLGIISGQLTLNYNGSMLQALDVISANSMTSSWSVEKNITSGRVELAFSGTNTLVGSGVLVYVRFRVAASASGSTAISFSNVLFNENLNANTVSGQFTALTAPVVVISPSTAVLTKGDTLRFRVTSGGTPPFSWSTSNTPVASIDDSTGLLTGLSSGSTTVSVVDSFGFSATTGLITVNELSVSLADTGMAIADTIELPLHVGNLGGLNVLSYDTRIVYDSTVVRFIEPVTTGTLSAGMTLEHNDALDTLRLGAIRTTALSGSGTLLKLRFRSVASSTGLFSGLKFARFQFNEGSPSATALHGRILILAGDTTTSQLTANIPDPTDPNQRPRWVPTGVYIVSGDSLIVTATGSVNDGGGFSAGPNGTGSPGDPNPSFPDWYNSVSHISLIGRVRLPNGTFVPLDDGIDASGTGVYGPGFVGESFRAVMTQTGSVELSINDGDTYNNSGSFTATLTAIRQGPAPFLVSINVTPDDSTIFVGESVQFTATGTFNNLSRRILTPSEVSWSAAPAARIQVDANGLVSVPTSATPGSATVTATSGAISDVATVAVFQPSQPPVPVPIFPANGASGITRNPTLRWNRTLIASSYRLQVSIDSSFATSSVDSSGIPDSSFSLASLNPNTTYFWRLNAANSVGTSPFSQTTRFTTIALPSAPTLFTPADGSTNVARNTTLRWYRTPTATSYRLQVSPVSDFSSTIVDSVGVPDSLFLLTNLAANTPYFWRVNSTNEAGTSAFSTSWRFTTGTSTSAPTLEDIPSEFRLHQNYPNPFNPSTTIEYQIAQRTRVMLIVYNVLGELVKTLVDQDQEAGYYNVPWRPALPSGVYFYVMRAGEFVETKKLLLMK